MASIANTAQTQRFTPFFTTRIDNFGHFLLEAFMHKVWIIIYTRHGLPSTQALPTEPFIYIQQPTLILVGKRDLEEVLNEGEKQK